MKTNNYSKFNMSDSNRKTLPWLVDRLIESISSIWYLEYNPVIVDVEYNIIDWQHRFLACKNLWLPIYYEIEKGDADKIMIALNTNQKWWKLSDYISYYANKWVKWYVYFNNFKEKYKFGDSTVLSILAPHDKWKIKEWYEFDMLDYADDIALTITRLSGDLDFAHSRNFVLALSRLFRKWTKRDINKLLKKALTITKQWWSAEYVAIFENKINSWRRTDERISLAK